MKVLLISPKNDLIEVILRHLSPSGKDYSSNLVIFPGKRPSHFLRKAISKKEGSSILPPRVFSMDEFIDEIYIEYLGERKRKLESIDAVAILYEIHKRSSDPIGERSFLDPDTFFPIGLKLFNDLEELYIEDVLPRMVREIDHIGGEGIPEPTAKRLQSLSYFYEKFYREIDEADYSTRSSRYREVSLNIEKVNFDSFERIILSGFFGLTKSEKRIFNFLKNMKQVIFIFQDGFGIELSDFGLRAQREVLDGKPSIHFYKSPDTHGQVLGVSRLLKDKIERGERLAEDTVIVLPSAETLFPLFHHTLRLLRPSEYNISLGYPLHRTPLFGLFNNLTKLVVSMDENRLYVPYYLEFILHPYIKNIYFDGRAEITRILFHSIQDALTIRRSRKFMSLSEIENDETVIKFIEERILRVEPEVNLNSIKCHLNTIHEKTIKKILSSGNVSEFSSRLKEVIEYIYEKSTARLHPFFYPYAEAFATLLDNLSRSLMGKIRFEEIGSYFKLIKKVITTTYIPFHGTPLRGIQVLGFLETRNIRFENVIFLDLNEGIVPEIKKEDTLLPFKVRENLGLPTYLDREKLWAYYFDILIRGAQEVHLFYVENSQKDRSRFVERLLWERQKEEKKSDDKSYIKTIKYSLNLQGRKPHPVDKSYEMVKFLKDYPFSASSLDTYLNCQLMFYYRYVLGLEEKEIVSDELEREEIGLLVHRILFEYFKEKLGKTLSEKDMNLRELEGLVGSLFEEQYGKATSGEFYLLRRQIEKHLKDFIVNYQIPKAKETSIEIISLENRLEVLEDSFRLLARLDRVEKRGERITIIDYKTSASRRYLEINFNKLDPENRSTWSEAIGTLQLPFYLYVYSQHTGIKPEEIDCLFLLLGRNIIDNNIELPLLEDRKEFAQRFGDLHYIIFSLLGEITDRNESFMPTSSPKDKCENCLYRHICTN